MREERSYILNPKINDFNRQQEIITNDQYPVPHFINPTDNSRVLPNFHQDQYSVNADQLANYKPGSQSLEPNSHKVVRQINNMENIEAIHVVQAPKFPNNNREINSVYSTLTSAIPYGMKIYRKDPQISVVPSYNTLQPLRTPPSQRMRHNMRNLLLKDVMFPLPQYKTKRNSRFFRNTKKNFRTKALESLNNADHFHIKKLVYRKFNH